MDLPSVCPLDCPDSCSLTVTVEGDRVTTVDGSETNPYTQGFICAKVRKLPQHLYGPERVLYPQVRVGAKGAGAFRRVSWDEALDRVAAKMRETRERFGGEAILPLCYGGSNGALTHGTLDERLWRRLGASRLLHTICAAPSGSAMEGLYGRMPGVALPDYLHARLIVLWGVNPHASGIHLVPVIQAARKQGAELVVVDPRRTPLAKQADLHLAPRPGTDLPLALALIRPLFAEGGADAAFLAEHTRNAEALRERAEPWTVERAAATCGLDEAALRDFARRYAAASPAVIRCGWGPERNRNGGSAIAAILALPAVAGKLGVRGGGFTMSNSRAIPLRDATGERASSARAINMNRAARALTDPDLDPPVKLAFVYDGNPLTTFPNQRLMERGLAREDLFTVVFEQVLTDTARYADVLLPATTFLEHTELKRSYGGISLQRSEPVIPPVGEARSNLQVFAALLERLDLARPGEATSPEAVIAAMLGDGEEGARLAADLGRDRIAYPAAGFRPVPFVDHFPRTPDRKVDLCPAALDAEATASSGRRLYEFAPDPGDEDFPLALISPASTRTISSTFGQLVAGKVPLGIHPDDAAARGIADGAAVRVWSALGELRVPARLDPDLRPGVVHLPKGLWGRHTLDGNTSNAVCPDALSDLGGGACFNDARVQVEAL